MPPSREPCRRAQSGALLAVLGTLMLLLGACATRAAPSDADTSLAAVRSMLRQRVQLLLTGDADAYLRPVGPEARPNEEMIARGAAAVSLSFANLSFKPRGVPAADAAEFRDVEVTIVYRYKGLPDDNPFRFGLRYDVERRAGAWTITRSAPDADLPLPLWARSPVEVARSPHFLAVHAPGLSSAGRALELAELARTRLAPRLEFGGSDTVHLVFLARDHAEYQQIVGEPVPEESLAVAESEAPPFGVPESRRMTVNLEPFLGRDDVLVDGRAGRLGPVEVFQHELAHLALAGVVDATIPGWVNEGAAMYLAGERRERDWRIGLDEDLFESVTLAALSEKGDLADSAEYAYANAAVLYLIDEFGPGRFWDFFIDYRPQGGGVLLDEGPTEVLLREAFDLDHAELDRRTVAFMDREGRD